jgi:hypothetical protein
MIEELHSTLTTFTEEAEKAALEKCKELSFDTARGVVSLPVSKRDQETRSGERLRFWRAPPSHSPEWNKFVYVIYETKRIMPEKQWVDLLRKSAVSINTNILVLSGEEPRLPKQKNKPKSRKRSHRSMSPTR